MTGETQRRRTAEEAQSRRDVLRTLGITAVGIGAGATGAAGTAAAAADFEVEIIDAPEEMVAGESANITARIENTGDEADTQTIRVNYGLDTASVSLGPGQSTTVTLTIQTSERDAGNQLVEVSSIDDDDGVRVDMLEPPYFVAEIVETNSPVVEGRTIEVTVEVTNTGEADGSATLEWKAAEEGTFGQVIKEEETGISAGGGQTASTTLTVETEPAGERKIRITVAGVDETDSEVVQMVEAKPPIFEVEITEVGEADEGDDLDVTVAVTNTGNAEGTKEVTLGLGDAGSTTTELTVAEAETVTETIAVPTEYGTAGTHTLTVSTEDDEATQEVEIGESAFFEVELLEHNSPVPPGFDLEFDVEVANTGRLEAEQTVEATIPDVGSDSSTASLQTGESTTLQFAIGTDSVEFDTYQATIASEDDSVTQEVEVAEVGYQEISDVSVNTPVAAGEEIEVTVTITNVGSRSSFEDFVAEIEGIGSESTSINLEVDDSTEETFTFPTGEDDAGDHVLRLATESVSTTQTITVEEAASDGEEGGSSNNDDNSSSGDSDDGVVDESDDEAPGFGIGAALSGLGGLGYLLKRRLDDHDGE